MKPILNSTISPVFAFTVGPSGSGKGFCVGDIFAEFHGVYTFVTGDWCRTHQSELAHCGTLAPDQLINQAVEDHFCHHEDNFYNIDAPRTVSQADHLIQMYRRKKPDARIIAFHIEATHDQSFALIRHRATRQRRADDAKPEAVEKRLTTYFKKGGIQDRVLPFLRSNCDDFIVIRHQRFDEPLKATDDYIDEVMVSTREFVRVHVAPEYFARPVPGQVAPSLKPVK